MVGRQGPTFEAVGAFAATDGPACAETLAGYGISFDAAQRHQLDLFLARDALGRFAAKTIGLSEPRQNGKSYAARFYAIWCSAVCGMQVVYSAHKADTVREFFQMLLSIFGSPDAYPDFAEELVSSYRQAGAESMTFASGGRLKFSTRTNSGTRGGTCSVLIIDEAQELTDAQLNAILPTVSASATMDQQAIYVGTPPDASCAGTVFRRMHRAAHSGEPGAAWWMEWAAASLPDEGAAAPELLALAYETNPALGARITEEAVLNEIEQLSRDGFARERLGWWASDEAVAEALIGSEAWSACETSAPMTGGVLAYGVKFSPDGQHVALSAALAERGGPSHVELVELAPTARGTGWLRDWIARRRDRCAVCVIDGKSGAANLAASLVEAGVPRRAVIDCSTARAIAASSLLVEEVRARTVSHIASEAMDASAAGCVKRTIGSQGGYGFGDGPDAISAPVESAALALWGARTTRRDPGRKQVVW